MIRLAMSLLLLNWFLCDALFAADSKASGSTRTKQRPTTVAAVEPAVIVVKGRADSNVGGANIRVPRKVDPTNKVERVLLLAPHGPLVVQLEITIDGKPFHELRETIVDDVLKLADKNQDGKSTWKEAEANKALRAYQQSSPFLAIVGQAAVKQATQSLAANYDVNKDGLLDRYEARLFVARRTGGPALSITGSMKARNGKTTSPAWDLLDENKDGTLSAEEIKSADRKLKARDTNDDDALTLNELIGTNRANPGFYLVSLAQRVGGNASDRMAFLLGPTIDVEAVQKAFTKHYADAMAIAPRDRKAYAPLLACILDSLDKNRDNSLDATEIRGLNQIAPHVVLRAEFTTGNEKPTVTIVSLADELGKREDILVMKGNGFLLNMYGANLNILPESPTSRMSIQIAGIGRRSFKQLDVDKNGNLDKAEVVGDSNDRRSTFYSQQFENWDSNSDGKVTKQEHSAFLQRSRAPVESRINLKVEPVGYRLFTALDINGDNQLGLREMRLVSKQLVKLDRNQDGKITQTEVPGNVNLDLSLGDRGLLGGMVMIYREGANLARRPVIVKGPDWFKRMDRNSDGDVTLKEFLGNAEQFKKIDTNKDGFIEPSEAIAFDKSG